MEFIIIQLIQLKKLKFKFYLNIYNMETIIPEINKIFKNDFIRLFLLVLTGIYAGYTLQPVPKWLNNLFDTSQLFKFIIIMIIGITALYPIDKDKLFNITLMSIIILILFELFRKYDK
jgi:hypothetical protein